MDRFLEMQTFNAVVETGSFVAAAELLQLSKAAVYAMSSSSRSVWGSGCCIAPPGACP